MTDSGWMEIKLFTKRFKSVGFKSVGTEIIFFIWSNKIKKISKKATQNNQRRNKIN